MAATFSWAEREGFEPSTRFGRIHTFQACQFNHSCTSPKSLQSYCYKPNLAIIKFLLPLSRVMYIEVLKSKIHRAKLTETELHYVGSITIDEALMDAANLIENEKVQVVNVNNGERLETYVIKGERHSGVICLNGPAARKGFVGDHLIIISYASMSQDDARSHKPVAVYPDHNNKLPA